MMIDARLGALVGLDRGQSAHRQDAATVRIGVASRFAPEQCPPVGKSGPGMMSRLFQREQRLLDHREQRVAYLGQIVRRNVGRHPTAMPSEPLMSRSGTCPQKLGFLIGAVVVGFEIDSVLVDIGQHPLGEPSEARLGVAISGGRVAVDGAEIALAIDERVAQRNGCAMRTSES